MSLRMGISAIVLFLAGTVAPRVAGAEAAVVEPPLELEARVEVLVGQLKSQATRKAAWTDLVALGREATPFLLAHAKDPHFTVRWEVANIQGSVHDERAVPALVENVLHDADPHIRWRSMWALSCYRDESQALSLLREALKSGDEAMRWNAAVGLSMMGASDGVALLDAGVAQADSWRRWEAINALGRVHDAGSVASLTLALGSRDVRERTEAVMSLAHIPEDAAVDALVGALADASPDVRWRAVMALGRSGRTRVRAPLERLGASEKDPRVREQLRLALERLPAGP